ncbi:unnamed protein product [marine sediment metagenome]|uniref:Uncharacterized protein n=1 Tax=marine sediment metagenome TaxID=412755 RepID=X1QS51_9ZZZZ
MSCDDMYVCEEGTRLPSCRIKIMMGKCDKFNSTKEYEIFICTKFFEKAMKGKQT